VVTATVRLASENHQPFSALWRFEQGQVFELLSTKISAGQVADVRHALPEE
jgi:uncharacterized protein (DUF2267 family)